MKYVNATVTAICPYCGKENQEYPVKRHCIHFVEFHPILMQFTFSETREQVEMI